MGIYRAHLNSVGEGSTNLAEYKIKSDLFSEDMLTVTVKIHFSRTHNTLFAKLFTHYSNNSHFSI